jgi:hypothetical protein
LAWIGSCPFVYHNGSADGKVTPYTAAQRHPPRAQRRRREAARARSKQHNQAYLFAMNQEAAQGACGPRTQARATAAGRLVCRSRSDCRKPRRLRRPARSWRPPPRAILPRRLQPSREFASTRSGGATPRGDRHHGAVMQVSCPRGLTNLRGAELEAERLACRHSRGSGW